MKILSDHQIAELDDDYEIFQHKKKRNRVKKLSKDVQQKYPEVYQLLTELGIVKNTHEY
jgi:hypothetical protein